MNGKAFHPNPSLIKCTKEIFVKKLVWSKGWLLETGFAFLPQNLEKTCKKLHSIAKETQCRIESNRYEDYIVAKTDTK